ncbi:MAG TPA: imidazole glycerol phosphate synthase subunit HisH [Thermoplasmata archaeon]
MKITIMDYGVGNLHSMAKGLEKAGARTEVVSDPMELLGAECVVFPGVGAFGAAMDSLRPVLPELRKRISGRMPTLGVCLGMQILFERSEESPGIGVSALKGEVRRLRKGRVPQMGWNDVSAKEDMLFEGVPKGSQFYFANSYVCYPVEPIGVAETVYGDKFVSAVRKGKLVGVQFHPEKSGLPGLRLLSNFVAIAEGSA